MSKTKYKPKLSIRGLMTIVVLSIVFLGTIPTTAVEAWGDNFDDNNYLGWIVQKGLFSTTDQMLETVGNKSDWHEVYHPSTVAYGTWSVDLVINTTSISLMEHLYIQFLVIVFDFENEDSYELTVWLDARMGTPGFILIKRTNGVMTTLGEYEVSSGLSNFQDIDITRDTNGNFNVFVNGSLVIEATDTTWTTSLYFRFVSMGENAIDNITVDDEVIKPTKGKTPSSILLIGSSFSLGVIVIY
ncbi:MAG: hypothetical protein ACW99R_05200, partial [Candidatus Hodarchaeales archaeon]